MDKPGTTIDIRVTAKAQNAILVKFAEDQGGFEQAARRLGVCMGTFSAWVNFRCSPGKQTKTDKLKHIVLTLERDTGRNIRDIFPLTKEQMRRLAKPRVYERSVETKALMAYAEHTTKRLEYTANLDDLELKDKLAEVIHAIPTRLQELIRMRYGLDGNRPMTLEQVGHAMDINKERVRQLEARALRLLQDVKLSSQVVEFLD
jgi:RNA polymerase sigma factor (sigma-70 family)